MGAKTGVGMTKIEKACQTTRAERSRLRMLARDTKWLASYPQPLPYVVVVDLEHWNMVPASEAEQFYAALNPLVEESSVSCLSNNS